MGNGSTARGPSLTAMAHAFLRYRHATTADPPIYSDTMSVQLLPKDVLEQIESSMRTIYSAGAVDAMTLLAVLRFRLLDDRLSIAHEQGLRQLVILGAGLDTTGFRLPGWAEGWSVFEVDHPATQAWKRQRIAELGWDVPVGLTFAPCDFEQQRMGEALAAVGFERGPTFATLLGVVLYLTTEAAKSTFADLASMGPGSQVLLSYCAPPDGTDPVVDEVFAVSAPVVDEAGEGYLGYYRAEEIEQLLRDAGFREVIHHSLPELNDRYLSGRADGLRARPVEQLVTAAC